MGIGIGILLLVIGLILLFAIKDFPAAVQDVVDKGDSPAKALAAAQQSAMAAKAAG